MFIMRLAGLHTEEVLVVFNSFPSFVHNIFTVFSVLCPSKGSRNYMIKSLQPLPTSRTNDSSTVGYLSVVQCGTGSILRITESIGIALTLPSNELVVAAVVSNCSEFHSGNWLFFDLMNISSASYPKRRFEERHLKASYPRVPLLHLQLTAYEQSLEAI